MEKTKLGISVGFMAALMCLAGWFGGYVVAIIVAGYILIAEEDKFLKQTAVKVVVLMFAFSLASVAINFIPDLFYVLESFLRIFNTYFHVEFIDRIFNFLGNALSIIKILAFAALAFLATKKKSINVPFVDSMFE